MNATELDTLKWSIFTSIKCLKSELELMMSEKGFKPDGLGPPQGAISRGRHSLPAPRSLGSCPCSSRDGLCPRDGARLPQPQLLQPEPPPALCHTAQAEPQAGPGTSPGTGWVEGCRPGWPGGSRASPALPGLPAASGVCACLFKIHSTMCSNI